MKRRSSEKEGFCVMTSKDEPVAWAFYIFFFFKHSGCAFWWVDNHDIALSFISVPLLLLNFEMWDFAFFFFLCNYNLKPSLFSSLHIFVRVAKLFKVVSGASRYDLCNLLKVVALSMSTKLYS